MNSDLIYNLTEKSENKLSTYYTQLSTDKRFFKREVLTRVLAVVSPIFFLAMFIFKAAAGLIDLGDGLANSLKSRKWDRQIFNGQRAKNYLASLGLSFLGVLLAAPAGLLTRSLIGSNPELTSKLVPAQIRRQAVKTDALMKRASQATVDGIYDLFEGLDGVLRKSNISYTLCGGSLLGSVRHDGFIPWDDDGDIAIDHKDQDKLLKATALLKEKGMMLVKHWVGYKICPINGAKQKDIADIYNPETAQWEKGHVTYPFIDVFPMERKAEKGVYVISSDFPKSYKQWPNELFTDEEWNSITDVPFGHITLRAVRKDLAANYCTRDYGKNWPTIAKQWWDHENEVGFDKERKLADFVILDRSCARHSKLINMPRPDHKAAAEQALATMSDSAMDRHWQLDRMFGTIKYINLDIDQDRLAEIKKQFQGIGLEETGYTRHKGTLGRDLPKEVWDRVDSNYKRINTHTAEGRARLDRQHMGQAGCYMSHYTAIKETAEKYTSACKNLLALQKNEKATADELAQAEAEVRKYSSVLIIEDDTIFGRIRPEDVTGRDRPTGVYSDRMTREGTGRIFYEAMRDLPKDWDMLYLMVIPYQEPEPTKSKRLLKLTRSTSTIAYAVSARMYSKLLKHLDKIEQAGTPFTPIDDEISALHPVSNCFVVTPSPIVHPGEASTINGVKQSDNLQRKYWQCDPLFA